MENREEKLQRLQHDCDIYIASLKQRLKAKLSADIETRIRDFELTIHKGLASARQRYDEGMRRANDLPIPSIKEIEIRRLEETLGRSIDFHLNLLSQFKQNMEALAF